MWRKRSPCRSRAITWWWICSGRHCKIRKVAKGASAPCPPSITDRASKWWACGACYHCASAIALVAGRAFARPVGFAHPTISGKSGARRLAWDDDPTSLQRGAPLREAVQLGRSPRGRALRRRLNMRLSSGSNHRRPIKLRLLRRSLHGFGRGLCGCTCERSWAHRPRIRGLGHAFIAQRCAKMHCASTHVPTEHCVLRLSHLPLRHELGGDIGHSLDPAFSFGEVVTATSDTDTRGVMDVRGMCGHKSVSACSHCGCT